MFWLLWNISGFQFITTPHALTARQVRQPTLGRTNFGQLSQNLKQLEESGFGNVSNPFCAGFFHVFSLPRMFFPVHILQTWLPRAWKVSKRIINHPPNHHFHRPIPKWVVYDIVLPTLPEKWRQFPPNSNGFPSLTDTSMWQMSNKLNWVPP